MTGKERDELGRLQAAPFTDLAKYVEDLLEEEYDTGYEDGWNEGVKKRGLI